MDRSSQDLRRTLKEAGYTDPVINAAWPEWWSQEAAVSPSACAELRFSVARKLGLSATSLFDDTVTFSWGDDARFRNLSAADNHQRAVLSAFGVSVGRILLRATNAPEINVQASADELRAAILCTSQFITLQSLLSTSWALGIPVVHLRTYPLGAKRMDAMVVGTRGRFAVMLAKDSMFPAAVTFSLAHEIGHAMLGHISDGSVVIDLEDEHEGSIAEQLEQEADEFALRLLLGDPNRDIVPDRVSSNAAMLADAALTAGPQCNVEPGTLVLCLAHKTKRWDVANAAMRLIYTEGKPVWREVNRIAISQLDRSQLSSDSISYLSQLIGDDDGAFR